MKKIFRRLPPGCVIYSIGWKMLKVIFVIHALALAFAVAICFWAIIIDLVMKVFSWAT